MAFCGVLKLILHGSFFVQSKHFFWIKELPGFDASGSAKPQTIF